VRDLGPDGPAGGAGVCCRREEADQLPRRGSGSTAERLALVVTGSLLSIIPLIAAFLLLQRFWQSGLTAGGVKG